MSMVEGKGAAQEQEVDYEFFKAGVDGRKDGETGTDKRFGESAAAAVTFQALLFHFGWYSSLCLAATFGAILGAGGVAYMARQFKNRPKDMKISVYLIHTRMYAQMTVVGRIHSNILIVDRLTVFWKGRKFWILKILGVLCCGMLNQMWKQHQSKAAVRDINHQ